ncbi:hypothetical protein FPV67DRAFT_1458379 [Lyophyllum atratum]|nr:hypothetical protein FPV67DRAFT_1458379 [Lyophyllum atratum]
MPPRKSNLPDKVPAQRVSAAAAGAGPPLLQAAPSEFAPHTLDSLDTAQKKVAATAPVIVRNWRCRAVHQQLEQVAGDRANLLASTKLFNTWRAPFISASTRHNQDSVRYIWTKHFTWLHGSQESALMTLQPKAPLPDLAIMKALILHLAMSGRSNRIPGVTGWNYKITLKRFYNILGMLSQAQVETPTAEYRDQVLSSWEYSSELT